MKKLLVNTLLVAGLAGVLPGQNYTITTVAGLSSAGGGLASLLTLPAPVHAVGDAAGNVYVSDLNNGQGRILKINGTTGQLTVLTTIGSATAQIRGMAIDATGAFLYIADTGGHRIRKVDTTTGANTTVAGTGDAGFSGDGRVATSARVREPRAVWLDSAGNIFFSDWRNSRIRRVDVVTGIITTVAGRGPNDNNAVATPSGNAALTVNNVAGDGGRARLAFLANPGGIVGDNKGSLYIADTNFHRIRKLDLASGIITTVAGLGTSGSADGVTATQAQFNAPTGLALDKNGNLLIADSGNNRIRLLNFTTGTVTTVAGGGNSGADDRQATTSTLSAPSSIALANDNDYLIGDQGNGRVRRVDDATSLISTIAGSSSGGGDNGPATNASFNNPRGVAVGADGRVYISDSGSHKVRVVDPTTGIITRFLGTGASGNGTNNPAPASGVAVNNPGCLTVDASNSVYVADRGNSKVRKVDATSEATTIGNAGGINANVAGGQYTPDGSNANGANVFSNASTGTGNPNGPNCVAADNLGVVYVADTSNHVIRKIEGGNVTTVVGFRTATVNNAGIVVGSGVSGSSGDNGPATEALLNRPEGVDVNAAGTHLCVADTGNHVVKLVDLVNNTIIVVAGIPNDSNSDTFTTAVVGWQRRLNAPSGCRFAADGTIFIADTGANRVLRLTPALQMTMIAGGGTDVLSDGKAALTARIFGPVGIDVDNAGAVYFTDRSGSVKKLTPAAATPAP